MKSDGRQEQPVVPGHHGVLPYEVRYRFVVDAVAEQGGRVAFFESVFGASRETILQRYPVDESVAVHYAPEDPTISVLEAGLSLWRAVFAGVASLLFTVLGGWGLTASIRLGVRRS